MATIFTDGVDAGHMIVFANDAFLTLTGFGRDDLLGRPLKTLLSDVTDASTLSSIQVTLDEGGSGSWEMQCRRVDRTEFLAAVFLSPVRDRKGTLLQNVLSFVDLRGHVERLLDQRNEFHAIYDNAPGFIATSDGPDHRFTFANASYKKFVGREHLVGLTVAEALPEIADQGIIALLDEVYRTGEPFVGRGISMGIRDPATNELQVQYCDFVYQAVRDAKQQITGLFCEGYDVTEQHKATEALATLQSELIHIARVNAMGTMATTLAHELNQPLSAISNYAAGALRLFHSSLHDTRLGAALHEIEDASQRAAEIIRNLRDLTVKRETAKVAFDMKTAIAECVRLVRATCPPDTIIDESISENVMAQADRIQIQQVVINLLRNACDAVSDSDQPHVSIRAAQQDETVVVRVIDSGSGVPLEAAQNIFSWSDSSKEGGMGLGLSISRTIVETNRGRIWLEQSGPDGSEFCFSLPLPSSR